MVMGSLFFSSIHSVLVMSNLCRLILYPGRCTSLSASNLMLLYGISFDVTSNGLFFSVFGLFTISESVACPNGAMLLCVPASFVALDNVCSLFLVLASLEGCLLILNFNYK